MHYIDLSLGCVSLTSIPDVHQFSIITELLGTPPEDVIQTIASENVRLDDYTIVHAI